MFCLFVCQLSKSFTVVIQPLSTRLIKPNFSFQQRHGNYRSPASSTFSMLVMRYRHNIGRCNRQDDAATRFPGTGPPTILYLLETLFGYVNQVFLIQPWFANLRLGLLVLKVCINCFSTIPKIQWFDQSYSHPRNNGKKCTGFRNLEQNGNLTVPSCK